MFTLPLLVLIVSFAICAILCPIVIPLLKRLKFGQFIREEGPEAHLKKAGTPTMGGIMILISFLVPSIIYAIITGSTVIIPVILVTAGFGIIGFIDDFIKVVLKRSLGFRAWQKMLCEIVITVVFCIYLMKTMGTDVIIPFTGGMTFDFGFVFVPLVLVAVLGTVNGANFTDGLDGLASSVTSVIAFFFVVVSFFTGILYKDISGDDGSLIVPAIAMLGALLGFLIYNVHPAKVFMGDTGSLALGGFVAAMAFMLKMPIFLIPVAFIYIIEILSVIIQVCYFKVTHGKRIFRMSPIHHHYELGGWSETKVVAVFTIITIITCCFAFVILV